MNETCEVKDLTIGDVIQVDGFDGNLVVKAAKKVKKAVTPDTTTAACKDGTTQTGKTNTTACVDHGGVKS